jgi:hypothetical protein
MTGPAISETSSTNEVKKADTSVQVERLALCPAHIGTRSARPAASAAIARFLTSSRCSGYGKISAPFRFKSSITRLWIARASLPVNPFVKAVRPALRRRRVSRCRRLAPDSSHARNTVPIWTASAPRASEAITPRASPIPPAAITDTSTMSTTCGTSDSVPVSESSAGRRNEPRCPPASKPEAAMASTPAC